MGWEPNLDELPKDADSLAYECQQALLLFNLLPDKIEGMSGSWLGKELSGLSAIMDIYEIDNRREVFDYFLIIQRAYSEYYAQQQKMNQAKAKAKGR